MQRNYARLESAPLLRPRDLSAGSIAGLAAELGALADRELAIA